MAETSVSVQEKHPMLKAVLLAAGFDNRLHPLTVTVPPAALPVANVPLVRRSLDYLHAQAVDAVIINTYRLAHAVEAVCHAAPVRVSFAYERPPFGSATALRRLQDRLRTTFAVIMGDVITDIDLQAALRAHRQRGALVTIITVDPRADDGETGRARYGWVEADAQGRARRLRGGRTAEPGGPVNAGIYLMEPAALAYITPAVTNLGADLLPLLIEAGVPVHTYHARGYWLPVASHRLYAQATLDVLAGRVGGQRPAGVEVRSGVWVGAGAQVSPQAVIHAPVAIGAGATIGRDVILASSAVGDGCVIRRGARVRHSVVLPRTRVGLAMRLEAAIARGNVLVELERNASSYVVDTDTLAPIEPRDWGGLLRQALHSAIALLGLIILLPVMLLIALLVKLDSPGPVLYTQLRVGAQRPEPRRSRVFELYKFRTMYVDADRRLQEVLAKNQYRGGAFVKIENDPRITRIGRFLRATSLDELPQLFNVVKGDMQLVGNRPLPVYEAEALSEEWQQLRFNAPAGLTGLWQISGRSDLSAEERIVLDNYYAVTHSFWNDAKILLLTIPALLARRGAQ
jgi:lipopolysaccharide/colanic/teichoic acid biosynthesis glycosyltransferase/dTDP-glucose pyrophosphorylase